MLLASALSDAAVLIKYSTRFTNEVFSALIGGIFIYEALKALFAKLFEDETEASAELMSRALLTLLLGGTTFFFTNSLLSFRHSAYLLRSVREFMADFNAVIALAFVIAFDYIVVPSVKSARLAIPTVRSERAAAGGDRFPFKIK
jgi:hypothetical protein